jgi:hypothetical protein
MPIALRLEDVRHACRVEDPDLPELIQSLSEQQGDDEPESPLPEGSLTFDRFLAQYKGADRTKDREAQKHHRDEALKALAQAGPAVPMPQRLHLDEVLLELWRSDTPWARSTLLRTIASVKLCYGPWRGLKRIFKEAEERGDWEVYGALAARLDRSLGDRWSVKDVGPGTLAYLARRAWRTLRRLGQSLPALYPDCAADILAHYPESTSWDQTWVANHIFFHETKKYSRGGFHLSSRNADLVKHRAFADAWKRSPRPLFALLERARSDRVRAFAADSLKADFQAALRDVEPAWVARLIALRSQSLDEFAVWVFKNVPRFEEGNFRKLGLHEAVLRLLDSSSNKAAEYAANYARTHGRDIPVTELIRLANSGNASVRKLASDLLTQLDPRKQVGLASWSELLGTSHAHAFAAEMIQKHFGARELTPEWFAEVLSSDRLPSFEFAKKLLPTIHPPEKLGPAFFAGVLERMDRLGPLDRTAWHAVEWSLAELTRFDVNGLDPEFLMRALIRPLTRQKLITWIDQGRLKASTLGVARLKVLVDKSLWESDPWIRQLLASDRSWVRLASPYIDSLGDKEMEWLRDVRRFAPAELGQDWLMGLVTRSEPRYHDFATEVITKGFAPADFAPQGEAAATTAEAEPEEVDLGGATFLFTGALATMKRADAEAKVKGAKGTIVSSVTAKLHYLVIGDEGSPLFGHGKKGSKQLKAEELNSSGGNIRIISETAFLQMLAGRKREVSSDATMAGAERLWEMATAPGKDDAPLARFAIKYLRRHHADICLAETDRPVDPGFDVPQPFWTFERFKPLFGESRKHLRDFALSIAKWELVRWDPSPSDLVRLCELPYSEVRKFIADALLAEDDPEHKRYRIDPDKLSPAAVYGFCESSNEATRALGMRLIERSPRLKHPEELFRLTESPDRKVRAFVVRTLWDLYRDRGVTAAWKPYIPPAGSIGVTAKKRAESEAEKRGPGVPLRPEEKPADESQLSELLRRMLFELPPGRMPPASEEDQGIMKALKPLPARKAKLALIETIRDLAIAEPGLARAALPVLGEFMGSRGRSERDACLVAVTRIRRAHAAKSAV